MAIQKQNLIGKKYGKLTVISEAGVNKWKHRMWLCSCECGNKTTVDTATLNSGHTQSCGCMSKKAKDLTGMRFGYLTVIKKNGRVSNHNKWLCKCDCGNEVSCFQYNLERGTSTSCGCKRSCYARQKRNCHGESTSTLYKKWSSMKTRCENSANAGYKYYGGKGIKICDEWQEFWNFREWAYANGYKDGLTIERIDINGDYCPQNCKWISAYEQASNKRNNSFIEYGGKKQTASQWARELGIGKDTITYRIRAGWSPEECLFGKNKRTGNSNPKMEIPEYLKTE